MILRFIAYFTSSEFDFRFSSSIAAYLWQATVRGVILSSDATSFIDRPSANSCSTSRCRQVGSGACSRDFGARKEIAAKPSAALGVT